MYFQIQKGAEGSAGKRSAALQSCGAAYLAVTPHRLPLECKYGPLRLWSCEGKDDISIMLSQHSGLGRAVAPLHPGPNPPIVSPAPPPSIGHSHLHKRLRDGALSSFSIEDFIRISILRRWIHHTSVMGRYAAPPSPRPTLLL